MRVLVADDSALVRSILVRVLRMMGVRRIVEAANGLEAWEAFETHPTDLVVTDWHMPYVDGFELTKRIRQVAPHVPIMMVTVVDSKDCVVEALRAGVNEFVCKPIDRWELEAKLDRFIPVLG